MFIFFIKLVDVARMGPKCDSNQEPVARLLRTGNTIFGKGSTNIRHWWPSG